MANPAAQTARTAQTASSAAADARPTSHADASVILVASSGAAGDAWSRSTLARAARIVGCWPMANQPRLVPITFAEWSARCQDRDDGSTWWSCVAGRVDGALTILACCADESEARLASRLLHSAGLGGAPGMVLCELPEPPAESRAPASSRADPSIPRLEWACEDHAVAGVLAGLLAASSSLRRAHSESASQHATAMAAARQIEEQQAELHLALQVQRELLPRVLPEIDGLELGVLYRPGATLSGDSYDLVRLDQHRVGILVADACGHGVSAALLMMLVGRLLPSVERDSDEGESDPGETMTRLNREFIKRRGDLGSLVSAAYAVIDSRTGLARIAVAGHPPPLWVRDAEGREFSLIDEGGPLLGVSDDAHYHDAQITLAPGQSLVLYSDGFEHAFRDADRAPADPRCGRHLAVLASVSHHARPVAEGAAGLEDLLVAQRGSLHQSDDMTLVAVRRCA